MKQRKLRLKVWLTRDFWGNAAPVAVGSLVAAVSIVLRVVGIDVTSTLESLSTPATVGILIFAIASSLLIMFVAPRFFAKRRLNAVKRRIARLTKRINAYDGPRAMPGRSQKGLPRDGRSPDTITQDLCRLLQKQERYREEIRALETYVRRISKPLVWS